MSENQMKKMIADTFLDIADALDAGLPGKEPVIGVAVAGTEHGIENIYEGIRLAEKKGCKALVIDGEDSHKQMESMIESGQIQGAVTMHYPFPIGVSTVGRVITPGKGREMFLATTTGTSSTDRVEGMVKNAIFGIISARACGISEPTVGIANIDGARQAEKVLMKLKEAGYPINFAESSRADGGVVMRGNDLLEGTADVMVMDPLTGNLMMKLFSAYTTGGSYESLSYGYGPGIGEDYDKVIMIVSRASGAPVIAGAIQYASELLKNNVLDIASKEFELANKAGLKKFLEELKSSSKSASESEEVKMPTKEVCTAEIHGIEVIDLEDAAKALWAAGIYAETGMGCTGPVVLMAGDKESKAREILIAKGYIA